MGVLYDVHTSANQFQALSETNGFPSVTHPAPAARRGWRSGVCDRSRVPPQIRASSHAVLRTDLRRTPLRKTGVPSRRYETCRASKIIGDAILVVQEHHKNVSFLFEAACRAFSCKTPAGAQYFDATSRFRTRLASPCKRAHPPTGDGSSIVKRSFDNVAAWQRRRLGPNDRPNGSRNLS